MIRISLGNVGSGKTASEVRELFFDRSKRMTYTNIETSLKNCITLKPEMIIIKKPVGKKIIYDVNVEFWKNAKKPINVVIDEAHNIIDSRNSMSRLNRAVTAWQSAIRRVLGESEGDYGELVYITQLLDSVDVRTRDLCTQFRYHICHYMKTCEKCSYIWKENSEMPEKRKSCQYCGNFQLKKSNFTIEILRFSSQDEFNAWKIDRQKTYYARYYVSDIEKYFNLYDTLQWTNLFSSYQ